MADTQIMENDNSVNVDMAEVVDSFNAEPASTLHSSELLALAAEVGVEEELLDKASGLLRRTSGNGEDESMFHLKAALTASLEKLCHSLNQPNPAAAEDEEHQR